MSRGELPILAFATARRWTAWLAKNHATSSGIWLRLFKKSSGEKSVTYDDAIQEALCYGWIDGQAKSYDENSWLQRFTPRRPASIWSQRNTERAERLIEEGRMTPAGLREVERAKADGRWEKAYASPRNMTVPADFLKELAKNKRAEAFFRTLDKANIYAITWRLATAKKPETRQRRMKAFLEMLARGEKLHE